MPQFARGSSGIIIVCDVTRKATVDAVRIWKNEADKVLTKLPPCILLVNKVIMECFCDVCKPFLSCLMSYCLFISSLHFHLLV